ncbi:unnamed protein product [Somion occarium]
MMPRVPNTGLVSEDDAKDQIADCLKTLQQILDRASYYRSVVEIKTSGKSSMKTWIKAGWMLFKVGELEEFRMKLHHHNTIAARLLASMQYDSLQVVHRTTKHTGHAIEDVRASTSVIECNLNVALGILHRVERHMPHTLGYSWEGNISSAISFEDALGRKYLLPREFCQSPTLIRDLMSVALRDVLPPDLRFITWEQAHFWISEPDDVDSFASKVHSWSDAFEEYPQSTLQMSLPVLHYDRPTDSVTVKELSGLTRIPLYFTLYSCSYGQARNHWEADDRTRALVKLRGKKKRQKYVPLYAPDIDYCYCVSSS